MTPLGTGRRPETRRSWVPGSAGGSVTGVIDDRSDDPVPDDEVRDELPAELDAHGLVGPYMFPNNSRRRVPGFIYLALAAGCVAIWATHRDGAVLVNGGWLAAAIALALFGLYHLQAGWDLAVDENDALLAAARAVDFPVGHASAQMSWRGMRSRPTWRILCYSNVEPPDRRGLVFVDGIDGSIVAHFTEDNPEDWAAAAA